MKKLTNNIIIQVMAEEWQKRIAFLTEKASLSLKTKVGQSDNFVISPELKILHKNSGIRYTVDSVSMHDVVLRTPENTKISIDVETLEKEYKLD